MARSGVQKVKIDLSYPTGNFWVDTGIVILVQGLGKGEHSVDDVLQWLLNKLVQKTGKKGKYYDKVNNQLREYDKEKWVYPTDLFIRVSGTTSEKVEIGGKKYPAQPPKFELKLTLSKKPGVCDLCGNEAPLTDAKMWMFPFVVDPGKFGNFYSGTKRGLRLCARCALAGLAGYFGWLWKAQERKAFHFFIFHSELREMERLHREVLEPLRIQSDKSGNFRPAFSGAYIHETTLGLLLALFAHIRQSDQLSEEGRLYLAALLGAASMDTLPPPITLYAVTGEPGQAFNMKALREFTKLQLLYRLYERWVEIIAENQIDTNPHRRVVQILRQFEAQQGNKRESLWRDKIARAILKLGDPLPFVEQFLFDVRAREQNPRPLVQGSMDLFNHYILEVLGMDEQFQRTLAGFGHSLGEAAQEHNEMGLLYALRNAKNPEDFYRVLNDTQFRLEVTIPEALLKIEKGERIAGVPWVRVKTLLSIYAMNSYLRKRAPQTVDSQNQKEE
ncbi:MAG: hypothetical protein H5U36_06760 [Candidatus Caldatribacterium sp.]|nr:hypothetical protein [Candidatus Caldatribacterium sp.]